MSWVSTAFKKVNIFALIAWAFTKLFAWVSKNKKNIRWWIKFLPDYLHSLNSDKPTDDLYKEWYAKHGEYYAQYKHEGVALMKSVVDQLRKKYPDDPFMNAILDDMTTSAESWLHKLQTQATQVTAQVVALGITPTP